MSDHEVALMALRSAHAVRSPSADPIGRAMAGYRLAVALGEAVPGDHRGALQLLEQAGAVLTEKRAPLEYGRILTAAASQHRALGDLARASELFERAAKILDGRAPAAERAAGWSNVGLVQTELAQFTAAVTSFDQALAALADTGLPTDAARIRATVLINRGLALFGLGRFSEARADLEAGLAVVDVSVAPMQLGMAHHSLGQLCTAEGRHADAVAAFTSALRVFTRVTFPQQHAVATFNIAVAHAAGTQLSDLRLALWSFETAANLFDPRLQTAQWTETVTRLGIVTKRLSALCPDRAVAGHRAALLGSFGDDERLILVRELVDRFAARPDPQRTEAFRDAAEAMWGEEPQVARAILATVLFVLAEFPDPVLRSGLTGELLAHGCLPEPARLVANTILDQLIQEVFQGPQRVRFRDVLYELGWERP